MQFLTKKAKFMKLHLRTVKSKNYLIMALVVIAITLSACRNTEPDSVALKTDANKNTAVASTVIDDGFERYMTISNMYSEALMNRYDKENSALDYLYLYSNEPLKKTIKLAQVNTTEGSKSTSCAKAVSKLYILPSTNYVLKDLLELDPKILEDGILEMESKLLKSGNVRTKVVKNYEKADNYDFSDFKDFSLDCESRSCVITDVFDSEGNSAKQLVEGFCR